MEAQARLNQVRSGPNVEGPPVGHAANQTAETDLVELPAEAVRVNRARRIRR